MATAPDTFDRPAAGPGRGLGPPQIAAAILGVLLVLALLWVLFLRGGDEPADTATPVVPAPLTSPAEDDEEVEEAPGRRPVETFEVFAPKDPFDPLISAAAAGDGTTGGAATNGATGTTGEGTTTTDGTTTSNGTGTTTTTTTTGANGGGGEDVGGHRVRVIDVFRDGGRSRAQVQVDGTVYTVDEGERFAQNFQLLSTSGQCATMLFGDDEFTLCEGEEILK